MKPNSRLILWTSFILLSCLCCDAPPEKPSIPLKDQLRLEGELLYVEDPIPIPPEKTLPSSHNAHMASTQEPNTSETVLEEEILSEADTGNATPTRYKRKTFAILGGFEYEYIGGASDQIYTVPETIQMLHQTEIVIEGYMLPTSYEENFTKKFLLLNFQMNCCYGQIPKLNEIIVVTMKEGKMAPLLPTYVRCKVYGRLEVERKADPPEEMVSLYRMEATKVIEMLPPILKVGDEEF